MAKFNYRLKTLHKLREIHRDEMQAKLTEATQAQVLLQQEIENVRQEANNLEASHRNLLSHSQADINQLLEFQRYLSVLRAQEATMLGQAEILEAESQRRRQTLVEASRDVRVLEKLRERQLAEHKKDELRAETKELDEIAARQVEANKSWA